MLSEPTARWFRTPQSCGPPQQPCPGGAGGGWARSCINKKEPQMLRVGAERESGFGAPVGGFLRRNVAGARPGRGARGGTKGDGFPQPSSQHKPQRPSGRHQRNQGGKAAAGRDPAAGPVPPGVLRGERAAGSAASPGTSPGAPPGMRGCCRAAPAAARLLTGPQPGETLPPLRSLRPAGRLNRGRAGCSPGKGSRCGGRPSRRGSAAEYLRS